MNEAVVTNSPVRVQLLLNGFDFDYPLAQGLEISVVELVGDFVVSSTAYSPE